MTGFTGVPLAALDFYDDLEADNSRAWWAEHRSTYDAKLRAPFVALLDGRALRVLVDWLCQHVGPGEGRP